MIPAPVWHMAGLGLITSVVAPTLVVSTRRVLSWRLLSWPALVALPAFLGLHAALMLVPGVERVGHGAVQPVVLLLGAVVFWLPVLGVHRPLALDMSCMYLFLGAPSLDLAGVWMVARGDSAGGLAMIAAMLPIGGLAVVRTVRWVTDEERHTREAIDPLFADPVGGGS